MQAENNTVVVFVRNNARVLHNPPDLEQWKLDSKAAVNPDLSCVKGLPPHLWDFVGGKVVPLHESLHRYREERVLTGDFETSCIRKEQCVLESPVKILEVAQEVPVLRPMFLPLLSLGISLLIVIIWKYLRGHS